jgi:hypothetical protein
MKLEMNAAATAKWHTLASGNHVLVVDDFLADAQALRDFGLGLAYRPPSTPDRYPGWKAYASLPGAAATKTWAAEQMLARLYHSLPGGPPPGFHTGDYDAMGVFSVFAAPRGNLAEAGEDQHTDGFAWLAMVLHLTHTTDDRRGTALWEHRPTGVSHWLRTDPVRMQILELGLGLRMGSQLAAAARRVPSASLDAEGRFLFRPRPGRRPFTNLEDEEWKLLGWIPARWNRMVIYPTWQIHSVVDMSDDADLSVENARLTYNQMVEYPMARETRSDRTVYERGFYRVVRGLPR